MLRMSGKLRVVPLTKHVSLNDAIAMATPQRIFQVIEMADATLRAWGFDKPRIAVAGRLDVLVHCAGVALQRGKFVEADMAQVEGMVRINLLGTMYVAQAFLALLQASKGILLTFSSTLAQRPRAGSAAYSATKGAVEAFSRSLAIEAAEHGVRVNCIAPGLVRSDIYLAAGMSGEDYAALLQARAAEMPLKRVGEPQDICALVSYLASDKSSWITGQCFAIDGGAMLR